MTVRLTFLGNDPWSVATLDAIAGEPDLQVGLVVTNPPRPAGRGSAPRSTAVADAARRLELPLVETEGVRGGEGRVAVEASRPDALVVVAYGELLPPDLLALPPSGALNLHFSLLPRWRGAAPVQHAILAGDAVSGVTVMQMDAGLDTGPILAQLEDDVRPEDDAGTLGARLAHLGAMLMVGVLRRLPVHDLPPRKQDERRVTHAPRLGPADRQLDWTERAIDLARRVRALAPEPGASTSFRGEGLKVLAASAADVPAGRAAPPGTVLESDARSVLVAAGEGGVRLLEVAPAGRKRMAAGEWANGARFRPGERLG